MHGPAERAKRRNDGHKFEASQGPTKTQNSAEFDVALIHAKLRQSPYALTVTGWRREPTCSCPDRRSIQSHGVKVT